jgi:hypothetical protein
MSLNLAALFYFWSRLLIDRKCKKSWELSQGTGQNFIQWIASQPLSLLLNNQFDPLASCPLDKDNFIQYFEQPGPEHFST